MPGVWNKEELLWRDEEGSRARVKLLPQDCHTVTQKKMQERRIIARYWHFMILRLAFLFQNSEIKCGHPCQSFARSSPRYGRRTSQQWCTTLKWQGQKRQECNSNERRSYTDWRRLLRQKWQQNGKSFPGSWLVEAKRLPLVLPHFATLPISPLTSPLLSLNTSYNSLWLCTHITLFYSLFQLTTLLKLRRSW